MRRLVWLRVARMLGQSTMIRLSLRSIVVVALTDMFRVVVILLLMARCLRVPPRLPRRVGRVTERPSFVMVE